MGKKRRILASKKKFSAKHSSHPRMKHIMKTEEAKTIAAPVTEPTVTVAISPPETVTPVVNETPIAATDATVATAAPIITETTPATEKAVKVPVIKKATTTKKKTRRSTTKSKTISRNA